MNQKSQPLVSVVLVCYNHEKFILDSIRSIINQNYEKSNSIISNTFYLF